MEKVAATFLAFLLLFSLTGCRGKTDNNRDLSTASSEFATKSSNTGKLRENSGGTAASFSPNLQKQQTVYLWEKGNMPIVTQYTKNNGNYTDNRDFRPNLVTVPAKEGTKIKGAILICSGGAFQVRSNGKSLDLNYIPDKMDEVSADASSVGMIYSFYGRLAIASTDVKKFAASDLPPAYFVYGTKDPFADDFPACAKALRKASVSVEEHVLQGWPHGFGANGDWIPGYDKWLTKIFKNN
ncbi:alpha/beta hydrolase [Clostridium felsineum]|uniref:alpha/beta hydrolase n=1 Tax=Clostridium felsineum TaxID=36839 RepID=UPI0009C61DBF|nr:alpha/beta hydrolase fold domain-containing protein [Clostridium felsineum]URZ16657.1 hypothetical protein CLFE_027040 [Clostridium felsineum DSM 794]